MVLLLSDCMCEEVDRKVVDFAVSEHKGLLERVNAVESGSWVATGTPERMYLSQFMSARVRSLAGDIPFTNGMQYLCEYNRRFLHQAPPSKFRAALVFGVGAQFELSYGHVLYNPHEVSRVFPSVDLAYRLVGESPVKVPVVQRLYLGEDDVLERLILDTDVFGTQRSRQVLRDVIIPAMHRKNPTQVVEQHAGVFPEQHSRLLSWKLT